MDELEHLLGETESEEKALETFLFADDSSIIPSAPVDIKEQEFVVDKAGDLVKQSLISKNPFFVGCSSGGLARS